MNIMKHDGFVAMVDLDEDAGVFHGRTINTLAMLTFESDTVAGLQQAFADTIDDYRNWCRERGKEPEKPYSGNLSLQIPPDLHRRIVEKAIEVNMTIDQFIKDRLEEVA